MMFNIMKIWMRPKSRTYSASLVLNVSPSSTSTTTLVSDPPKLAESEITTTTTVTSTSKLEPPPLPPTKKKKKYTRLKTYEYKVFRRSSMSPETFTVNTFRPCTTALNADVSNGNGVSELSQVGCDFNSLSTEALDALEKCIAEMNEVDAEEWRDKLEKEGSTHVWCVRKMWIKDEDSFTVQLKRSSWDG